MDVGGNNSTTTNVPDIAAVGYPACMDTPQTCTTISSSNKLVIGVDVVENDASLASLTAAQFFQNFFGLTPTTYRSSMVTIDTTDATAMADADGALSEVVWVEGDATFNGIDVGSSTKPSIFIINGNATFQGNSTIYGVVFIMGNASITGNTTFIGSAVIGGTAATTGSLDIIFSSAAVNNTSLAGGSTGGAGSWRDF